STLSFSSTVHGFLALRLLPGGIGTRIQPFNSLSGSKSVQPVGSLSRALFVSLTSAAGASSTEADSSTPTPRIEPNRCQRIADLLGGKNGGWFAGRSSGTLTRGWVAGKDFPGIRSPGCAATCKPAEPAEAFPPGVFLTLLC